MTKFVTDITADHCRMHPEEARRQWVSAVMSGHFATAYYLEPDLPPFVPTDGHRNSAPASGTRIAVMIQGEIK